MNTLLEARHHHGAEICVWLPAGCTGTQSQPKAEAPNVRHVGAASIPSASPLRKSLQFADAEEHTVERPILVRCAVEADPALFAIDSANLTQATNKTTKARVALAQRNLQRETKLAQAEIVARKDLEKTEGHVAQAQSVTGRTRIRLAQRGTGPVSGRQYTLLADRRSRERGRRRARRLLERHRCADHDGDRSFYRVGSGAHAREGAGVAVRRPGRGGPRSRQPPGLRGAPGDEQASSSC